MKYSDALASDDLKQLVQSMNSRARAVKAGGMLTVVGLRDRIYDSGGRCEYCTVSLVDADFECDHIIPLRRGGGNIIDNIAIACPTCNRNKSDKHPARFAQETIARTGSQTPLLERILTHYNIEAVVQKGLFDADDETSPTASIGDEPPSHDDPPPYIWGSSS